MCGRITLTAEPGEIARAFSIDQVPDWLHTLVPRYNIAPSLPLVVVRHDAEEDRRVLAALRWGLVPFWAKEPSIGMKMINARCETVAEKPAFRQAFTRRRCLIPVDGFYEWRRRGKTRQPYWFFDPERRPFALAGLWESWRAKETDDVLETCTILTTKANRLMAPIHHRMPVILPAPAYATWLTSPPEAAADLRTLLQPCPPEQLAMHAVTPQVNKPSFDEPECLEPVENLDETDTTARPDRQAGGAGSDDAEEPPTDQMDLFGRT